MIKFISWNVNGLRALLKKPEIEWLLQADAQVLAIQETKASEDQLPEEITRRPGWSAYWDSSTVRKGYSGVGVLTTLRPLQVTAQLPDVRYQGEGRLLHLEFEQFHFFNGYFPNGGAAETDENGALTGRYKRVPFKMAFFNEFLRVAVKCQKSKPVVVCGDFNIAHKPLDVYNPEEHEAVSGYLPEERAWMEEFVRSGFVDTFRYLNGPLEKQYTWWSYQGWARKKNQGWRLDYFFVSEALAPKIKKAAIYSEVLGSDHCPVGLTLDI